MELVARWHSGVNKCTWREKLQRR